jgi:hypothetical protein
MTAPSEQLPFSPKRQDAILGHLLSNERFFKQCKDRVKKEWFMDPWASKVWQAKLNFYTKYGRYSTLAELNDCDDVRLSSQGDANKMRVKIAEAINLTEHYGLEPLVSEMTVWLHSRLFADGAAQSTSLYNAGKFAEAFSYMKERISDIEKTTFEEDEAYDFDNFIAHFARRELETQGALSFGIDTIDGLLLPMGTRFRHIGTGESIKPGEWEKLDPATREQYQKTTGSLLPGDTTVLLAPTNIGKTTTMITVAAANVRQFKHVLLITHEGVDDDIAEKMQCSMLNLNRAQLYDLVKTEEGRQLLSSCAAVLKKYFKYLPMSKAGLCVEAVAAKIRRVQEERIELRRPEIQAARLRAGKGVSDGELEPGFDLVIDDYPAKLWSENVVYGQFQKRNLDEYVYNYFVQLALEYKFHCLLAIQSNRSGAKINRGEKGAEDRLLTPEDVSESYGPMQIATNVITINRDPWCEANGYVIYFIGKSRSSERGWAIVCKSDYKNCITHSNSLGSTYYRGDVPLGLQTETLFLQNRGKKIERIAVSA